MGGPTVGDDALIALMMMSAGQGKEGGVIPDYSPQWRKKKRLPPAVRTCSLEPPLSLREKIFLRRLHTFIYCHECH